LGKIEKRIVTIYKPIDSQGGRMEREADGHGPIGHPLQRPSLVDESEH
jgi:hypothetical protein